MNTFLAAGLALCAATTFGLFSVMARKAMDMGSAFTASFISVAVGIPIICVLPCGNGWVETYERVESP